MGVQIRGADELAAIIRQVGDRAQRGVAEQMRKEAKRMRDLARQMAPVDEHNLERAIKMRELGGERNSRGQFARKSFEVFVDLQSPGTRTADGSVGQYAYIMHEHLAPYGPLKLGDKSRQKQGGQGVTVGGRYLERAVNEVSDEIMNRLIQVARSYF